MISSSNRRNLPCRRDLLGLLTGAAGVSLARSAFAQGASSGVTATKLSEGFSLITGAGTNVVSVTGPDGALMVDSGAPERSAELLKAIASQAGGKPVKTLFTTHWHPDHTGANEALGKSGAKIIAHAYTKQWMSTEIDWGWQKKTFEPAPKAALPTEIFYDGTQKLSFGAEAVQYGHLAQAHTDGDMYVYFPAPIFWWPAMSSRSPAIRSWTTPPVDGSPAS